MRKRSTSSQPELDALALLLGSSQLPVQQTIAREIGIAQSLVSRARNGKLTRITEKVRKLIEYAHLRADAAVLATNLAASIDEEFSEAANPTVQLVEQDRSKAQPLDNYSKEALEGIKTYLKEGYDPRLIVEQLAVLRRAQQVRRPGRR